MRARHYVATAALAGLMLVEGIPLAAQSRPNLPQPGPELRRLQREVQEQAARMAMSLAQKPKVVCGTTIIPADPKIDRKAIKPAPDKGPKSTIRQVPAPACR